MQYSQSVPNHTLVENPLLGILTFLPLGSRHIPPISIPTKSNIFLKPYMCLHISSLATVTMAADSEACHTVQMLARLSLR